MDTSLSNSRRPFPSRGTASDEIMARLGHAQAGDVHVRDPRSFRPSYFVNEDVTDLINAVQARVMEQNVLYAGSSYPSLREIERDVLDFTLDLLHAPPGADGTVTIGGSESNFMALKTARDWARHAGRPGEQQGAGQQGGRTGVPEIVLAHTAHPSLEKAAQMLGMRTRRAKGSVGFRADVAQMEGLVGPDTIMIVGSAPPAAYATIDPIAELGAVAERHGLWFHVDCCMGGFFVPFAEALGERVAPFDFRIPSVRSMSADLHKFGYAPKGVSVLLLRDAGLAEHRDYRFEAWPFGQYATTGVAGSRPAGPLVAAWAVMQRLGREGYMDVARRVLTLRHRLEDGIARIPGLQVLGEPAAAHLFLLSDDPAVDIFAVDEVLEQKGYRAARAWHPDSLQLWVSMNHDEAAIDTLLADLAEATEAVRRSAGRAANREAVYAR